MKQRQPICLLVRLAATKLTAGYKEAYFRRFQFHKTDQTYTVRQILESMELGHLLEPLCHTVEIEPNAELTYKNVGRIKKYFMDAWEQVLDAYQEQVDAGKAYYSQVLQGCRSAAAVVAGQAAGHFLDAETACGNHCDITGLTGTNSCYSPGDTGLLFQGSWSAICILKVKTAIFGNSTTRRRITTSIGNSCSARRGSLKAFTGSKWTL
ncbi:MAG: hypothetical protein ACLS8R_03685 [Anaeromassilibacillus sp.]